MKLSIDTNAGAWTIGGYEAGSVIINGARYSDSLIVTHERLIESWPPASLAELEAAHIAAILAEEPEIVLLGTGIRQVFPQPELLREAYRHGVGIEIMDTAAACRTFNLLAGEGRRVAAGLILE